MTPIDYNTPTVPPQHGKRFVMRNGEVTGEFGYLVAKLPDDKKASWSYSGTFYHNETRHPYDLIAVYEPPVAAKPKEVWVNEYIRFCRFHETKVEAVLSATCDAIRVAVRYVETPETKEDKP